MGKKVVFICLGFSLNLFTAKPHQIKVKRLDTTSRYLPCSRDPESIHPHPLDITWDAVHYGIKTVGGGKSWLGLNIGSLCPIYPDRMAMRPSSTARLMSMWMDFSTQQEDRLLKHPLHPPFWSVGNNADLMRMEGVLGANKVK